MNECSACGNKITSSYWLCPSCYKFYGGNRSDYPKWLQAIINLDSKQRNSNKFFYLNEVVFTDDKRDLEGNPYS
jgi:hypothetical protein